MARLWVILFVLWYRAATIAKSEVTKNSYDGGVNQIEYNNAENRIKRSSIDQLSKVESSPPPILDKLNSIEVDDTLQALEDMDTFSTIGNLLDQCIRHMEKRKFSSWGGKRAVDYDSIDQLLYECLNLGVDDEDEFSRNKMNFHSWGGKRDVEDQVPKRLPFRSWGGKRDMQETPKRLPFKAWGGKRSPEKTIYPIYSRNDDPKYDRMAMQSLIDPYSNEKRINRKKTKFHSWGGKRANVPPVEEAPRRLRFNSWGGKRSDDYDDLSEDKRTFHSWGGKRSELSQDDTYEDYPYKRTFHSWGGKRAEDV